MSESDTRRATFAALLRHREFRWLWLARVQSSVGDQVGRVALAILVFERTGSASDTALTYALTFIPAVLGGPLLGGLADVLPRRTVMIACDVARAGLFAAMAVRGMPLVALGALVFVATLLNSPFTAADNAMIPQLFDGELYPLASGLRLTSDQVAQLLGFAVGGALVAAVGTGPTLLVDAGTFGLSAMIITLRVRHRPAAGGGPRRLSPGVGLRAAFGSVEARTWMLLVWANSFVVVAEGLAVPYVAQLGGGPHSVGVLMAAMPAGYAVGTVVVMRYLPAGLRAPAVPVLAVLQGIPVLVLLWHPDIAVSATLCGLTGICTAYSAVAMPAFVRAVPDAARGAAIGIAASGLWAAEGVAIWGFGVLADHATPALAIGVGGAAASGLSGLVLAGRRRTNPSPTAAVGA